MASAPEATLASWKAESSGSVRSNRPILTLFSALIGHRIGSCITMAIRPHRDSWSTVAVSMPSHRTEPLVGR